MAQDSVGSDQRKGPEGPTVGDGGGATVTCRLDRTVAAVVFDWDGTAVSDRGASARRVRARIEKMSQLGIHAAVISGTHLDNVDGQLRARPKGPGQLLLSLNRGSELFEVTEYGPQLIVRRPETSESTHQLDLAAARITAMLRSRGLVVDVVSSRLNRRKIDLIPEPTWSDPPKARMAELVIAVENRLRDAGFSSISEVAGLSAEVAVECGLVDPRVTSDAKHVEVGITDKSDSMRDVIACLADQGVAGELVLVVGDEFGDVGGLPGSDARLLVPEASGATVVSVGVEPAGVPAGVRRCGGGPETFLSLLDEQLRRARLLRVPVVWRNPRWTVLAGGMDVTRHRVTESLFTLTSGGVGLRGSVEERTELGQPLVVANGVYQGPDAGDGLLPGPDLIDVRVAPPVQNDVHVLDLHTGVLYREEEGPRGVPLRSVRFGSVVHPGVVAMRLEAAHGRLHTESSPAGQTTVCSSPGFGGIAAVAEQRRSRDGEVTTLERIVAMDYQSWDVPNPMEAEDRLTHASSKGFEALLTEQRGAWSQRWEHVNVCIPEDPQSEVALRFVLFQLWGLCGGDQEVAVGARGLTGGGYSGHVFWDADVFVLPALMTIDPPTADAMVRYRLNRLGAARERARSGGRSGARFPWESALTGADVTPSSGYIGGERVPILTGRHEEHITADVAWSVVRNALWSRRSGRMSDEEGVLLAETARYWMSRIGTDADGVAHINVVIGPDEYHESVNDNAFTNAMARWNLRCASRSAPASAEERQAWLRMAASLVDGYDSTTGLYEQFDGYFELEPMMVRELAMPPVAADVLVGRARIAGSQVIKQPDVLMLHHLIPDEVEAGSLHPNLDFYGPRTAHGSSLSPAIMASLLARAGRADEALDMLRLSLRIDLEDLGGTTSAGVHIGACAGAWQALIFGFLGARVRDGALLLDPALPNEWTKLEVRFRCLGRDVRTQVDGDRLSVEASAPLTLGVPEASRFDVVAGPNIRLAGGVES